MSDIDLGVLFPFNSTRIGQDIDCCEHPPNSPGFPRSLTLPITYPGNYEFCSTFFPRAKYCVFQTGWLGFPGINFGLGQLFVGYCVPNECTPGDIRHYALEESHIDAKFGYGASLIDSNLREDKRIGSEIMLAGAVRRSARVRCSPHGTLEPDSSDGGLLLFIIIASPFGLLVFIESIYEIWKMRGKSASHHDHAVEEGDDVFEEEESDVTREPRNWTEQLALVFSVFHNSNRLIAPSRGEFGFLN
jgi:hypothetical protein